MKAEHENIVKQKGKIITTKVLSFQLLIFTNLGIVLKMKKNTFIQLIAHDCHSQIQLTFFLLILFIFYIFVQRFYFHLTIQKVFHLSETSFVLHID